MTHEDTDVIRRILARPDLITKAHRAVEDELISRRDKRHTVLCANGVVVAERDGTPSDATRMSTREAIQLALEALAAALEAEAL